MFLRLSAYVGSSFVLIARLKHTHHVRARCGNFGSRNAVTNQGIQTGSLLTRSPAPSARSSLKRMVAVTWSDVDVTNISGKISSYEILF